jgi:hypothetical protein
MARECLKHDFVERDFKRRCRNCGREEWMFENRHPAVGEPKYEWRDMTIRPMANLLPRHPRGTRWLTIGLPGIIWRALVRAWKAVGR